MKKTIRLNRPRSIFAAAVVLFLFAAVLSAGAEEAALSHSHEGYTLERAVVLSRHNIRSPLSGGDSILGMITPHEWFAWSSNASELSLRGGVLETEMGEYFRKWLEAEGLFPENYHPEFPAVRIYANSMQRTIATAQYFTAGLLPTANMPIEYHMDFNTMDPVFTPQLTFISEAYREYAEAQIRTLFTEKIRDLADNYALLADVIDLVDSTAYRNGTVGDFRVDDTELIIVKGDEVGIKGSLRTAFSVSDALVLQYYEEPDTKKAAFGHDLTIRQWEEISEIKDLRNDVLFTAPLIAVNSAHPLLQEIRSEMTSDGRVFTFLCGHDANINSALAALDAADYELPHALEKKAPIGSKLVFGKWMDPDGNAFWSIDLVYQTPDQMRSLSLLDMENPPAVFHIYLNGMEQNPDGLYAEDELLEHFDLAIETYDQLIEEYADAETAEPVHVE